MTKRVKVRPVALPHGPRDIMARLRGAAHHALLESALAMPGQAEWSYVAGPARAILRSDAHGTRLERDGAVERRWPDAFAALADIAAQRCAVEGEVPAGLGFVGGWVGVLGYDAARCLHALPAIARADPALPDQWWMAVDQVLAHHHPTRQWWLCTADDAPAEALLERARGPRPPRAAWRAGTLRQRSGRDEHEAAVAALRERIAAGALLQANLTRREDAAFEGDAWSLYKDLVDAHPAPFAAYLEAPGFAIASASPERFLHLRGRTVQARPIKGTAARGTTPSQDAANAAWLAASEKNRAENLMITDLMRNDLGRVAEVGSVRVPQLFALEPYASVWQLVSTVQAELRAGASAADLLRACWPPGSMTGAPKLAAMHAIETLEPVRRGFYAGSIGYLDCRGGMDLSVVIRSAVVADGRVMLQLGGGIVADSDPAEEWAETVAKGARLRAVIAAAAGR